MPVTVYPDAFVTNTHSECESQGEQVGSVPVHPGGLVRREMLLSALLGSKEGQWSVREPIPPARVQARIASLHVEILSSVAP
jgi:hypothetical protein